MTFSILFVAAEMMDMHTRRLLEMLLGAGHTVTLVARENPYPHGAAGFKYFEYPVFSLPASFHPYRLRSFLKDWIPAQHLKAIWKKTKPDLIHNIYIGDGAVHCAWAGLSPLILTALGSDINDAYEKSTTNGRERIARALRAASCVTADTQEVLSRCEALAGGSLQARLFYFGIDLNLFAPLPASATKSLRGQLGIPAQARIILSPRRVTPKMRHDTILHAFKFLKETCYSDLFLILRRFGSYSQSFENQILRLARDLGVDDCVRWLDQLEYADLPRLYCLADVAINVPEQDGLPVTLLEVSACETPVITSDLPSYREFLDEGSYFRVGAGDVAGLAHAIDEIFKMDPAKLAGNLKTNRGLVERKASQETCFAGMENIYREALVYDSK